MSKTTIIDIDLAIDVKNNILSNSDVIVPDTDLKTRILGLNDNALLMVVTTIGSHKKIIKVDLINDDLKTVSV